jgi:hypothetical protein
MIKNKAGQYVTLLAIDSTINQPIAGDGPNLSAFVKIDNGDVTPLTNNTAVEDDPVKARGNYTFGPLTQAEVNGDKLIFSGVSATGGVVVIPKEYATSPERPNEPTNPIAVDHNYGGKNNLAFVTADGHGIENATVQAFTKCDWDAGRRGAQYVQGHTTTIHGGKWLSPMMLDPGRYVLLYFREGVYNPSTKVITVA